MRKVLIGAVIAVSIALLYFGLRGHGRPDYRDPVQLARALKGAYHGSAASCAKIAAGKYICTIAAADESIGTYQVTVTADGSGYQAN